MISGKFYIKNDYLDRLFQMFYYSGKQKTANFLVGREKAKKETIFRKIGSFCFQAHKTFKIVQKIYLDSHFRCKISRRIQIRAQKRVLQTSKAEKIKISEENRFFFFLRIFAVFQVLQGVDVKIGTLIIMSS